MPGLTKVTIYTDGACSGNPGPGGWGAILMAGGKSREISGGEAHTTNNRMELMAVIKSLGLLTRPCEVDLYSDSAYLVNDLNEAGISVSSGSACSAASREASHVLLALGYDTEHASGSLRITLGRDNTEAQVQYLISVLPDIIMQRRLKSKNNPLSLFDAPHAPDTIDSYFRYN